MDKIRQKIAETNVKSKNLIVFVPRGAVSKAIGQRGVNKAEIIKEFSLRSLKFRECDGLSGYEVEIREEEVH